MILCLYGREGAYCDLLDYSGKCMLTLEKIMLLRFSWNGVSCFSCFRLTLTNAAHAFYTS
jgi:hypothetical protein